MADRDTVDALRLIADHLAMVYHELNALNARLDAIEARLPESESERDARLTVLLKTLMDYGFGEDVALRFPVFERERRVKALISLIEGGIAKLDQRRTERWLDRRPALAAVVNPPTTPSRSQVRGIDLGGA